MPTEDGTAQNPIRFIGYNQSIYANGDFDSADLVLAFQDGGYELGPREAVRSVPEPNESGAAVSFGFVIVWLVRRRRLWYSTQ